MTSVISTTWRRGQYDTVYLRPSSAVSYSQSSSILVKFTHTFGDCEIPTKTQSYQ